MKGKTTKLIENNTCVICKEGPVKILKADINVGKSISFDSTKIIDFIDKIYKWQIEKRHSTITKVDKKLISKTLKNCFKMKNRKPKRELNKWYTQKFTEEETWVANTQKKRRGGTKINLLVNSEMQTITSYLIRLAKFRKWKNTKCWQGYKKTTIK